MEILSFEKFRLLMEADEATPPAEAPVEAPAPEPTPAPEPSSAPMPPDMGGSTDPLAGMELPADPNAPAQSTASADSRIVFLDSDKGWHSKYTDGGGVKRYTEYQISQADLDKWITDSKLDANKDDIQQAIMGKKALSLDTFNKLKSAFSSGKLGKNRGDIDIEYDNKMVPSTNKLEIIFVNHK